MADNNVSGYGSSVRRRQELTGATSNVFQDLDCQEFQTGGLNCSTLKLISSPEHVFEVIRHFDERKKDIIRSIGFGGLLYLSRFSELDPNFSLWLSSKVRLTSGVLSISEQIKIPIKPEHIGKIFGIPYSGIEVSDKGFENEDEKFTFMKLNLSFLGNESEILQSAESYLARKVPFGFSKEEAHKFKVSFVIFVMGRFLAPSLDTATARSDFWGALRNPDAIHSFNWSSFLLSDIIEASRRVVWSTLRNRNVSAILGCPLFLQILYLDNIELGHLNLPHDVIPRMKHFNKDLLRKMIEADSFAADSSISGITYGRAKTLRTDNICYSFHPAAFSTTPDSRSIESFQSPSPQVSTDKTNPPLRRYRSHVKKHISQSHPPKQTNPSQCAVDFSDSDVPDFSLIMREYFQGQVDPALLECFRFHHAMCCQHFTKFVNGLKSAITKENITLACKVVNHQRQSSGLSPINLELCRPAVTRRAYDDMLSGGESGNEGEESTPVYSLNKQSSRFCVQESPTAKTETAKQPNTTMCATYGPQEMLHPDNFTTPANNGRNPKLSFQMPLISPTSENRAFAGSNLGKRMLDHANGTDLKVTSRGDAYAGASIPKKRVHSRGLVVPHWERNIDHPLRDVSLTHSFYDWLSTTTSSDLNKSWIIHDIPRYIHLSGQQIRDHFTDNLPMSYNAFDICVRRMRQLDKSICPKDVNLRWRHLIESDFSMHVLGGENPANNVSIRNQFVNTLLDFELERCRMFFVPVLVDGLWWCYAWDLKSLTLTIYDPSVGQESDVLVIQKHAGTIDFLSRALTETVLEFYSGWNPKFQQCNSVVFRSPDMPIDRSKSALFTLFFMKNYNGTNLVSATTMSALKKFKEYMLYEILEMKDNHVHPPSVYIHSVDD